MLQALDVQLHLRVAPLLARQVGHLDGGAAAVHAVGGDAQIGRDLTDDVAHHRGSQNGRIVGAGIVGVVQHDIDQDLRVVGGQDSRKGCHLLVVAIGAAVHVQLFGGAGLAADAVACNVGVAAAALGAVAHLKLHDLADGLAGALADDLTADVGADLLHHIAVLVRDLIHHMGGDQIAAVDCRRDGSAHLQRGHGHGLTKGGGGQLHLAQTALAVILHEAGLIGQVHTGALGKAEGIKVIIEQARTHALAQLDKVDVAAVAQGLGQILGPVRLSAGAVVGLLCHAVRAGAVQGGVIGRLAAVHTHGGGDDLEHASGVVQLGDGLVLPLDIPVGAGVVGLLIRDLLAVLVPQVVAVLVFFVDGVQLRLGLHLLRQVGQIGAEILRVIGVKVRLGGHGKDGTGLDVHHNGAATVLNGVGRHGLVQVALHHLLNVHIQ